MNPSLCLSRPSMTLPIPGETVVVVPTPFRRPPPGYNHRSSVGRDNSDDCQEETLPASPEAWASWTSIPSVVPAALAPVGSTRVSSVTTSTALSASLSSSTLANTTSPLPSLPLSSWSSGPHSLPPPPEDQRFRAVHRIRLSALQHNYQMVESAAARQHCGVITVIKADGYGHGAAAVALHLADTVGADALAVATLEEAVAVRKALEKWPPGQWSKLQWQQHHLAQMQGGWTHQNYPSTLHSLSAMSDTVLSSASFSMGETASVYTTSTKATGMLPPPPWVVPPRIMRAPQIRIMVLGAPVGFPRCFDEYYYYNIELMVSGPEVAAALMKWVADEKEHRTAQVELAARDAKDKVLSQPPARREPPKSNAAVTTSSSSTTATHGGGGGGLVSSSSSNERWPAKEGGWDEEERGNLSKLAYPASTLGAVSGTDLANEVRMMLLNQMNQKAATEAAVITRHKRGSSATSKATSSENSLSGQDATTSEAENTARPTVPLATLPAIAPQAVPAGQLFGGIEAAAKNSRLREMAASTQRPSDQLTGTPPKMPPPTGRKRLRWHAMVDSGMGRDGFKTEPVTNVEAAGRRDTVEILQELIQAEIYGNAPLEFYGMCTHMAEASANSDYTHAQMARFVSLLRRVRQAGISVPTISTDNSAALLTPSLTHFDPHEVLAQPHVKTRGYVRVGGAIYGQRPAFPQLKAVSTLVAYVRHVAVLAQGDSAGYDRAYVADHDVRIATLSIGFADGYPRELGKNVGRVEIRGELFPVVGNVCMDMLMVDLGPAEDRTGVGASVVVGDRAVMWGPIDDDDDDDDNDEGLVRLQDVAATLQTTLSALTCAIDKHRVTRQYVP